MRLLPILFLLGNATISKKKTSGSSEDVDEDEVEKPKLKPKKDFGNLKKNEEFIELGPNESNVRDRGLIVQGELGFKPIIQNHKSFAADEMRNRNFEDHVLAYVTPWNNHGYDVVKMFHKFTLVAPVWFQMIPGDKLHSEKKIDLKIQGEHDVDRGWISEVKSTGAKVVPRLIFEKWSPKILKQLLENEQIIKQLTSQIAKVVKRHDLDGITIEIWSSIQDAGREPVAHFLHHLADALHADDKILILVIPPDQRHPSLAAFTSEDFEKLHHVIDFFSMMTYDYSGPEGVFNAPVNWIEQCISDVDPDSSAREKILMGFNFYGRHIKDAQAQKLDHILGRDYINILKELERNYPDTTFQWHSTAKEHYLIYRDPETTQSSALFYPTLGSIQARIELARKLNVGISIWEVGQGLDYFYDLL